MPLTVQFNAGSSTGIVDGGHWDFGDGESSDTTSVKHKYDTHVTDDDDTTTYFPQTYLTVFLLEADRPELQHVCADLCRD